MNETGGSRSDNSLAWLGVLSGYGMTEAPILSMAATTDPDDVLATTEGRPGPGSSRRAWPGARSRRELRR
jgi:hypothetical protein